MVPAPSDTDALLAPGALWAAVDATEARARAVGALEPLTTRVETVPEAGFAFCVRVLEGMERKIDHTRGHRHAGTNPFLPPEPLLHVGEVSASHRVILNKFPVLRRHAVLVPRAFARQEAGLDVADFDAALRCLAADPALACFNGGRAAGASVLHRHVHLVPLPLADDGPAMPLAAALRDPARARRLPFRSHVAAFAPGDADAASQAYRALLARADLATGGDPRPHNLLLQPSWLAVVPRSRGGVDGIPTHAMGYAGALYARGDAQLARIRELGPLHVLRGAGRPW